MVKSILIFNQDDVLLSLKPISSKESKICFFHPLELRDKEISFTSTFYDVKIFKKFGNGSKIPDPKLHLAWIDKQEFEQGKIIQRWRNDKKFVKSVKMLGNFLSEIEEKDNRFSRNKPRIWNFKRDPIKKERNDETPEKIQSKSSAESSQEDNNTKISIHTLKKIREKNSSALFPQIKINNIKHAAQKLKNTKKKLHLITNKEKLKRNSLDKLIDGRRKGKFMSKSEINMRSRKNQYLRRRNIFDLFTMKSKQSVENALTYMKKVYKKKYSRSLTKGVKKSRVEDFMRKESLPPPKIHLGFRKEVRILNNSAGVTKEYVGIRRKKAGIIAKLNSGGDGGIMGSRFFTSKGKLKNDYGLIITDGRTYSRMLDNELNRKRKSKKRNVGIFQKIKERTISKMRKESVEKKVFVNPDKYHERRVVNMVKASMFDLDL